MSDFDSLPYIAPWVTISHLENNNAPPLNDNMKAMPTQNQINLLSNVKVPAQKNLIDGAEIDSASSAALDVISPIDGSVLTSIPDSSSLDIDKAVRAAKGSFKSGAWSNKSPAEKKKVLMAWAELIEKNALELTVLGCRDNGTEFGMAIKAESGSAASTLRYYAEAADKIYGEVAPTAADKLALIIAEPVGVVGVIVPWNFPLMIAMWKIAPALMAGNSVVLKPAEIASLSLLKVAQLAHEAGLPKGVLNVVTGLGTVAGEALALHNDVDVLAFTGSGGVGRRLLEYSARSNLKRIYLELGGKSANIVLPDCDDLDSAVKASVNGIFRNSGQVCVAASRLIVHESIHDEFIEKMVQQAKALKVGNPLDLDFDIGAVSSQAQLSKNLSYIDIAQNENATLVCGGKQLHSESGGTYMQPTILTDVQANSRLAQEEVFGPVLAVMKFKDEAQAIELANATPYGLSSGVWTSNLSCAHRMIKNIKAGLVHVNCYGGSDITVPLGGVKQSGNGHDKSLHAIDKYRDLKSAWIAL